jgi:deoxyribonuclease-1
MRIVVIFFIACCSLGCLSFSCLSFGFVDSSAAVTATAHELTQSQQQPQNFTEAKRVARQIFARHPITLYCGCSYSPQTQQIDLNSCSYKPTQNFDRAARMEFEHMMPMEHIGRHFQCWREKICVDRNGKKYKGRKCCAKIDSKFQRLEAELYNLWPAVGAINQVRSNWRYGMVSHKTCSSKCSYNFENCPVNIDPQARVFEPPDSAKGIVARANLYMASAYDIPLSKAQQQLFTAWHKQHPPTEWECSWAASVAEIQGVENPYIVAGCVKANSVF